MLITKFNALIRNRFIWGFFAVLVSITMVGFFTDIGGCVRGKHPPGTAGALDGKAISSVALQNAKNNVLLRLRLSTGRDFNMTREMGALVTREAWKRLALLQLAEAEKLWAGDGEVAAAVQRDPMFQSDGIFNRDRFNQFMQVLGQNYGYSPDQFWGYLREELTLDKIRRTVSAGVWTTPFEVERLARNFADTFTVDYVETPRSALTRDIVVTEAQIRAYYDTHTADFTIPDRVQVAYAAFPFVDYTNVAVSAESVTNYYADHMNDYFTTNEAGQPLARKIEEVQGSIRKQLARELQREKAIEDAARFADSLYTRSGTSNFFFFAAAATGKTVKLSRYFSAKEPLRELSVGPDFNSAAFSLAPEKDSDFSEPIIGSNTVYVLSYGAVQPSRVPPFAEARTEAETRALGEAKNKALEERSASLTKKIQGAVRAGTPFADAAVAAGLTSSVKTAGPFTAYTAPAPFDNARLITSVISLQEGEISDLVPSERGSLFLIRCKARKEGDTGATDPIRNQIRSSINRRHAQLLVGQWEDDLLKKKGYQEPAPIADVEETSDEDEKPAAPPPPSAGQL